MTLKGGVWSSVFSFCILGVILLQSGLVSAQETRAASRQPTRDDVIPGQYVVILKVSKNYIL